MRQELGDKEGGAGDKEREELWLTREELRLRREVLGRGGAEEVKGCWGRGPSWGWAPEGVLI